MTSLQVRELPENIYLKLQEEAKKENRSLAQQAVAVLAKGLDLEVNPKKRREGLLKMLREAPIIDQDSDIADPVQLIREDREKMILILDASAATEIVLQGKTSKHFEDYLKDADWITAPGLYIAEISNVFWKYHKFGNISLEQCERAIEYAINLPDEYSDDQVLYKEAFLLGCKANKPVYDMFYIILARRNSGYLLTLDKNLAAEAKKQSVRVIS